MYKSYFYLLRASVELNSLLTNKSILECYTQEPDKLFIHILNDVFPFYCFIVSTNPNEFHFYVKEEHRKAKKNTINFFEEYLPQKIDSVKIAFGERIICIELKKGKLFILFRGNKSNCFFLDNDSLLHPFKKIDDERLVKTHKELTNLIFVDNAKSMLENILNVGEFDNYKKLPYLSKEIIKYAESTNNPIKSVEEIINQILYGKIAVGIDSKTGEAIFLPMSMLDTSKEMQIELFDNYLDAITNYFSLNRTKIKTRNIQHDIEKYLENEIEKITHKLNKQKTRIENGSKEEEYGNYGQLLLSNIEKITKGTNEITLNEWDSNNEIKIKLDPKLSPQQNINSYFDKARSERIEFEKSKSLYNSNKDKFNQLVLIREKLTNDLSTEELLEIKKELKMKQQLPQEEIKEKIPFRHYLIEDRFHFYVGKDGKNNDMLTTKFAKQNDYWFHARLVAGSHGVLRVENLKEAVPKRVLEKAASIAAFYSKSKTSKLAPVTYTLKKYVTKNSRHEVGQVSVIKESVLLVKPGIPADCQYLED